MLEVAYTMADEMVARGRVENGKSYHIVVVDIDWLLESGVLDKLFVALAMREVPYSFDGDRPETSMSLENG